MNDTATNQASRALEARRGNKRERILQAALGVFAKKGYHDTQIAEIARAAGVADGTIYLYFESKEALLMSLFDDSVGRLFEVMDRDLAAIQSPSEQMRHIIDVQLGLLENEPMLAELLTVNLRDVSRKLRDRVEPKFKAYLERIAAVVSAGQQAGEFRSDLEPMVLARALFGALDGLTLTWTGDGSEPGGLVHAADVVATLVLEGLRTQDRS